MKFINPDQMPDSLLAGYLAERSLEIFRKYGDVYQVAGAYRTLASCYWNIGDYRSAIACLERALHESKMINEAPDLVASIRERLSLTYSALDDKPQSDYNRNIYLDMQDSTRQDRQLEARAEQLDHTLGQLNMMILAVALMILAVVIMLLVISYLRNHRDSSQTLDTLLEPLKQWSEDSQQKLEELNNRYEEINEERKVAELTLESNRRRNIENRAKVFLVNSVTPFIDRIIHEVNKLIETKENDDVRQERYKYVEELTAKINEYNDVLTQWIQLRQGQLSLRIESFPLQ
jgi:tetratricopeptide (TPR) repeat protein